MADTPGAIPYVSNQSNFKTLFYPQISTDFHRFHPEDEPESDFGEGAEAAQISILQAGAKQVLPLPAKQETFGPLGPRQNHQDVICENL